jgi:hypothetical protein
MKNHAIRLLRLRAIALALRLFFVVSFASASAFAQGQPQGQRQGQAAPAPAPAGQRGQGQRAAPVPARPTPRFPDGHVNLGPPPGEKGIWSPAGINAIWLYPTPVNRVGAATMLPNPTKAEDVPFQPWARALHEARELNFESDEPHTRCKASPGPREFITPYGTEFVEFPELQRMYIFDIGGPHTYRTIFMDGREHPKDLKPKYYGHSIGKWDGDSLVVDTVGFSERVWIDREGTPTTSQLHLIERFTRTDMNTLKYEVTVDDPGAYTAPWNGGFLLRWAAGTELFEYICQDNNIAATEMVGAGTSTSRTSAIVP